MVVKTLKKDFLELIVEDLEDVFKLTPILYRSTLILKRTQHKQEELKVKRKQKKIVKEIVLQEVVPIFKSTKSLVVGGYFKGSFFKQKIKILECLTIKKVFTPEQLKLIDSFERKKVPYLALDGGKILLGYIIEDKFIQSSSKYFNLKEKNYYEELQPFLEKIKDYEKKILRCSKVFVDQLCKKTNLKWEGLEEDSLLDWRRDNPYFVLQQKAIKDYFENKDLSVKQSEEALIALEEKNLKKVYLTPSAPLSVYEKVFKDHFFLKKVRFLKDSPSTFALMPQGFLLLKYF